MVSFYKHSIVDWRSGTVDLSDRAYRVYHVIVEEIMLNEGPVPLHERSLAGKANRSVRDFRAALDELVAAGKLIVQDGFVDNSRCEKELKGVRTNREHAASGGRVSGERRRNPSENNNESEAPLHSDANIKEKRREDREVVANAPTPLTDFSDEKSRVVPIRRQVPKASDEQRVRFWSAWKHRRAADSRKQAWALFDRKVASGADPEAIIRAAEAYQSGLKDPSYVALATTWLNRELWTQTEEQTAAQRPDRDAYIRFMVDRQDKTPEEAAAEYARRWG